MEGTSAQGLPWPMGRWGLQSGRAPAGGGGGRLAGGWQGQERLGAPLEMQAGASLNVAHPPEAQRL